ncbi:MAG: hypothetical protein CVT81_09225 [Alphaproteobacteria bacterium HGW-Alphaproteobacteria-3]|nr:MAG: hypothetical protein CVT81_09225 [Alphaproteobacteria bacterium HGW-Alphaproteobacteria-3]
MGDAGGARNFSPRRADQVFTGFGGEAAMRGEHDRDGGALAGFAGDAEAAAVPVCQFETDVFDYIERFYNPRHRHSTLGYLSPMEFEKKMLLA